MPIDAIRRFFASRISGPPEEDPRDRVTIAACALLLEIAHAEAGLGPDERRRIENAVREMGVAEADLREVLRLAEEERKESVDLYQFTRLVAENFSRDERLRLLEAIWGVVYSDGALSAVEGQLARRVAELLGFQHPEVQSVREKVAREKA
jgi:uncharacterized tellurite resistance protein B-like protein